MTRILEGVPEELKEQFLTVWETAPRPLIASFLVTTIVGIALLVRIIISRIDLHLLTTS